jgi:hypothetical protein
MNPSGKKSPNAGNANAKVTKRRMSKSELEAMKARAPKVSDLYYR